ncbi:MAG: hypothetical protein RL238_2669 [Actinomycetota bacterium]|jgi:hypothetical protein
MTACRVCGIELRSGDDYVFVADERLHVDCARPPAQARRRRLGLWEAMGSGGQMDMGDVQRDTPS